MTRKKDAFDMLTEVAATTSDLRLLQDVRRMQRRLAAISMADMLDKVPGDSVSAKAKRLGITRTTYYSWASGRTRPRRRPIVAKISRLTGYGVDEIRGE